MPALVLLTDDERLPDPARALAVLPRGSLVIVRAREGARRSALADLLARSVRARGIAWLIADDAPLACRAGADGVHFPERKIALIGHWRARRPGWFITCAAHSPGSCLRAARAGADAVLLSPVFATASHPGRRPIGNIRIRRIARAVSIPIYALGGIDSRTALQLRGAPLAGLAAITGLAPDLERPGSNRCAPGATTV
jgi:thiamine-phosphate pyrophosphorylase